MCIVYNKNLTINGELAPNFFENTVSSRLWVLVKSHYEEVIVITWVRGGAKDECNNNDNLRVQWDLTGFYPIVFDVRHITQ